MIAGVAEGVDIKPGESVRSQLSPVGTAVCRQPRGLRGEEVVTRQYDRCSSGRNMVSTDLRTARDSSLHSSIVAGTSPFLNFGFSIGVDQFMAWHDPGPGSVGAKRQGCCLALLACRLAGTRQVRDCPWPRGTEPAKRRQTTRRSTQSA